MSVFYVYLPVLVSAYLLTGLMALQPVFSIAGTMAILPQLGIGMAAVLLGGRHLLWGVFIGELLLQLLANHPLWTLPWYAAGQTAAGFNAGKAKGDGLLHHLQHLPHLGQQRDVRRFHFRSRNLGHIIRKRFMRRFCPGYPVS